MSDNHGLPPATTMKGPQTPILVNGLVAKVSSPPTLFLGKSSHSARHLQITRRDVRAVILRRPFGPLRTEVGQAQIELGCLIGRPQDRKKDHHERQAVVRVAASASAGAGSAAAQMPSAAPGETAAEATAAAAGGEAPRSGACTKAMLPSAAPAIATAAA
eukprot:CAMPEP_0183404176 /NCGR_PEP_ID=MMETSP0370-20130417/15017_1 /TAXON_ID=268820 /ORGANISM="Peridinium aciculiferum, Strain PAER-2" /LENGTH=159 /DNA_ID=CAMNT_0025586001 /DNA_START=85 /DNA_END=562 /DNA_ORIENTATION=+